MKNINIKDHGYIIITGPRSVGKTTIGKVLAKNLGLEYIDFDEYVETKLKGIDEHIKKYGVDSYRKNEEKILKQFIQKLSGNSHKCVFSVGGGTIASQLLDVSKRNAALIEKLGCVIYLTPDIADTVSVEKLYANELKRKGDKSLAEIKKLYVLRKPIYEKLYDIKVLTEKKSKNVIVKEIISALKKLE